jgi:hypothetical protein
MLMNVHPIAGVSERVNEVRSLTAQIVNQEIPPNENLLWAQYMNARLDFLELAYMNEVLAWRLEDDGFALRPGHIVEEWSEPASSATSPARAPKPV